MYWKILLLILVAATANAGDPGPEDAPAAPEVVSVEPAAVWMSPIVNGPKPVPERGPWHVGISGGQAEYGAIAGGRSWKDVRFELELGYGGDKNSGKKCKDQPRRRLRHINKNRRHPAKHYTSSYYYESAPCGRKSDDIWNLTAAAYPTWQVVGALTFYAGGGLGVRFVGDETEGVGKIMAGFDIEILEGVFIGAGFKGVLALSEGADDLGPFGGIRYRF